MMISRFVLAVALAILMVITGTFTYVSLGSHQTRVSLKPQKPTQPAPRAKAFALPGTLYLTQTGALYSLTAGRFHQLTGEDGWMQPSLVPDGSDLVIVKSNGWYSDVYVMSRFGQVVSKVTDNSGPPRNTRTDLKHWSFYPRVGNGLLWMAYDEPKFDYDTGFSIWAMPYGSAFSQARVWSNSGYFTGGDVQPVPLAGGVMYTSYAYVDTPDGSKLSGRLWWINRPRTNGKQLTGDTEDCRSPSLSPDGTQVAMVCTYTKQVSYLTIATVSGSNLGPRKAVITDQMVAQPTWAPDGSGIAYLAPDNTATGNFQLWFLPRDAYNPPPPSPTPIPTPTPGGPHNGPLPTPTTTPAPTPAPIKPIQLTTTQAFDATSPLAWAL